MAPDDFALLPGGDRVSAGLGALARGELDGDALLVLVGAPRLRGLGILIPELPQAPADPELALYLLVQTQHADAAHSIFNALRRELVSFAEAYERELHRGPLPP